MLLLDRLAESHIQAAMGGGEFEDFPGRGKPLQLDDDRLVPEALRAAWRLLKNAGCLPPEMEQRRELTSVAKLVATLEAGKETGWFPQKVRPT